NSYLHTITAQVEPGVDVVGMLDIGTKYDVVSGSPVEGVGDGVQTLGDVLGDGNFVPVGVHQPCELPSRPLDHFEPETLGPAVVQRVVEVFLDGLSNGSRKDSPGRDVHVNPAVGCREVLTCAVQLVGGLPRFTHPVP